MGNHRDFSVLGGPVTALCAASTGTPLDSAAGAAAAKCIAAAGAVAVGAAAYRTAGIAAAGVAAAATAATAVAAAAVGTGTADSAGAAGIAAGVGNKVREYDTVDRAIGVAGITGIASHKISPRD